MNSITPIPEENDALLDPLASFVRYVVYDFKYCDKGNHLLHCPIICQRNGYDVLVQATCLHYLAPRHRLIVNPSSTASTGCLHAFCHMLNYIIYTEHDRFHADTVLDITHEMMQDEFQHYAETDTYRGEPPLKETVVKHIRWCTEMMANLTHSEYGSRMAVTYEKLYVPVSSANRYGVRREILEPNFKVSMPVRARKKPLRDIPHDVLPIVLTNIYKYAPEIAFGCICSLYAGLRVGEVCNLRQDESQYGGNIRITYANGGTPTHVELLVTEKLVMRDELMEVGGLKKPREQPVFPAFVGAFLTAYRFHLMWLKDHKFDEKYAPILVDSRGNAMSEKTFRYHLDKVVKKHIIPELLASENPNLRFYGQLYEERGLDPHAFRHVFSTELVVRGCTLADIQFYRGDSSPESAFTYLQNKADLHSVIGERCDQMMRAVIRGGE